MNNQTRVIFIIILGLLISCGVFLILIKPTIARISVLNTDAVSKKTELKQLEEQIITYQNSQRDLSRAQGKEEIAQSLLERENLQYAIIDMEKAAQITGLEESLDIQEQPPGKNAPKTLVSGKSFLDEVPYTIKTTSDFVQLITFLKYLEHMPHFTEVSKFGIQSISNNSRDGNLTHTGSINGTIDLIFFVQKK